MSPFRNITFPGTNADRFSATCGGFGVVPFGLQVSADKKKRLNIFILFFFLVRFVNKVNKIKYVFQDYLVPARRPYPSNWKRIWLLEEYQPMDWTATT